ncbi:MAG: diadenylate cyclase CdaA [Oscillospiraceae bacterium]|nr:diadenylate cyclase CdaA [Oscillospiraceae bacterium]
MREILNDILDFLYVYVGFTGPWDIVSALIDVAIITYIIYKIVELAKETRAWQLLKGVMIIIIIAWLSGFLGLKTTAFLMNSTFQYITFAIIVLFQPELRRALEQIGRSKFKSILNIVDERDDKPMAVIEEVARAVEELSKSYTGALIIIEREIRLGDLVTEGIPINADVVSALIVNIFTPNTPLHDGALVIRDGRIIAGACFLPLTEKKDISKELGTRHRAALGLSEVSDALSIVVSEETGYISMATNGEIVRNMTVDSLKRALAKALAVGDAPAKKHFKWKGRVK